MKKLIAFGFIILMVAGAMLPLQARADKIGAYWDGTYYLDLKSIVESSVGSGNETLINRIIGAGTAAKANALAANGANCSAGQAPRGVDAAGAVEDCFTPTSDGNETQINRLATAIKALSTAPMNGTVGATTPASGVFTSVTADEWISSLPDGNHSVQAYNTASNPTCASNAAMKGALASVGSTPVAQFCDGTNWLPLHTSSTELTRYQWLPSGWFEDAPASPCAANAAISGEEIKGRLCDDNESVIVWWQVPPDWSAGCKVRIYYGVVTNAEADDTVTWRVQGCTVGNSEALTCTPGDLVSIDDELTTDDDANELEITAWSGEVTLTGIAAGELARITLRRGTDDEATEVNLIGMEIKYKAKDAPASDY